MPLNTIKDWQNHIFSIQSDTEFNAIALEIFHYQAANNSVYKKYIDLLGVLPNSITKIDDIPFLPIEFFKTHQVVTGDFVPQEVFFSSGTTGQIQSKHFVKDISVYEKSFTTSFELFYNSPKDICILALLPSYLQREGSSLVYMVNSLINKTKNLGSGFYLSNTKELLYKISNNEKDKIPTILIGVTYALLDIIEQKKFNLEHTIVMETGGMKGRRKEMVKEELHKILSEGFGVKTIHSEYGMTELLSQAYSKGEGQFFCPPWMKILIREVNDYKKNLPFGFTGGINIIDLANIHSCSFIASQDLGKLYGGGDFEVLGRFDNSDLRGCNLLVG
jgi:phenylacetate-coenzyme A ligase PaaK-like adenylate-forming protein